jgi:hypothetical protein
MRLNYAVLVGLPPEANDRFQASVRPALAEKVVRAPCSAPKGRPNTGQGPGSEAITSLKPKRQGFLNASYYSIGGKANMKLTLYLPKG